MVDTSYVGKIRSDLNQSMGTYLEVVGVLCGEDLRVDTSLLWNIVLHGFIDFLFNILNYKFQMFINNVNKRQFFENTSITRQLLMECYHSSLLKFVN